MQEQVKGPKLDKNGWMAGMIMQGSDGRLYEVQKDGSWKKVREGTK